MKRFHYCVLLAWALLAATVGCGGSSEPPPIDYNAQAQAKVDAFKRLADALAKDPSGIDARAVLEDIRNTPLDASKNRKEAEEILEIYRQRIKGKYKSEVAQEVNAEIVGIENLLKG